MREKTLTLCPNCNREATKAEVFGLAGWACECGHFWSDPKATKAHKRDVRAIDMRTEPYQRQPKIIPSSGTAKEIEAALENNLICNIRKQRPDMNRRQVRKVAKDMARSIVRKTKLDNRRHQVELDNLRRIDEAEVMPVKEA